MTGWSAALSKQLLESGEFSDCTIVCGGRNIQVHQNILCTQSPVLKELCEQGRQKYSSVRLQFTEQELSTLCRVLLYLYTGDYNDQKIPILGSSVTSASNDITNTSNSSYHCRSPRFAMESSKQLLLDTDEFEKPVDVQGSAPTLENLKVFFCADLLSIEPLKSFALQKFNTICRKSFPPSSFAEALTYVYSRTANKHLDLRTTVTRLCMERLPELKRAEDLVTIVKTHEPVAWNLVEISARLEETRKASLAGSLPTSQETSVQSSTKIEGLRTQVRGLLVAHERDKAYIQTLKSEKDKLASEKLALHHEVKDLRSGRIATVEKQSIETQIQVLRTRNERQQCELKAATEAKAETQRNADAVYGRLKRAEKALMVQQGEHDSLLDRLWKRNEEVRKCRICWTELRPPFDLEDLKIDGGKCQSG